MTITYKSMLYTHGDAMPLVEVTATQFAYYLAFALYSIVLFLNHTTFESVLGTPQESFENGAQLIILVLLVVKCLSQWASLSGCAIALTVVAGEYDASIEAGKLAKLYRSIKEDAA